MKRKRKNNKIPIIELKLIYDPEVYGIGSIKLCLKEKFEIITFLEQDYRLNSSSELIGKFKHIKKYLLRLLVPC